MINFSIRTARRQALATAVMGALCGLISPGAFATGGERAATSPAAQDSAPGALRLCALSNSLPYSAREGARGFDVAVAEALAQRLGKTLEITWTDNGEGRLQEIDESDYPLRRLAKNECDLLLSMPGPARDTLKEAPALALGQPYYGAAFELIGPPGTSGQLKALRTKPVAIQAQTVASFAIAILQGKQRTFFSAQEALDGVTSGEADAALLWGPAAGWALKQSPSSTLAIAEGYEPPAALAWNLHAATRGKDEALRVEVDLALGELARDGQLASIAAAWGIPLHAPFATTYSLTEINKLR